MSLAKSLQSKLAALISLTIVASAILVMAPAPAQAAGNAELRWIGQYSGDSGNRVYSGNEATVGAAKTAITADGSPNNVYRPITTDGTFLYFVNGASLTQIVKANLDGTVVQVLTTAVGVPEALYYFNGKIYYTAYNSGIYSISSAATNGVADLLISTVPNSSNTSSTSTSGWTRLAVDATGIYFQIYYGTVPSTWDSTFDYGTQGLYKTAWNGSAFAPAIRNADVRPVVFYSRGGALAISEGYLYLGTTSDIKKVAVADWGTAFSTWGAIDVSAVGSSPDAFSIAGSDIYFISGGGMLNVVPKSGASIARTLRTETGTPTRFGITAIPAQTVSFAANDGTSTVTTQSSTAAMTIPGISPRANHVFSGWNTDSACSSSGTAFAAGASYTPTADITLYACWTGEIAVSLAQDGAAITAYDFGSVAVGTTNSVTLYLKNIGATGSTAAVLRNASYSSGLGLTAGTPATCNFASGQLTFGNSCTTTVVWSPTAAQTLTPSASLLSFDGAASYSIQFSGAAAVNKVVTYDANGGTGTMASQSAISARNLTSNTVTRPNYTFGGWNTIALGGGTAYADGASYGFGSDLNLFAQWTLIPVSSGPTNSAAEVIGVSARELPTAGPQILSVLGRKFADLLNATVNGVSVKVLLSNSGEVKLDLGALPAGTYSITLNFADGPVVYQDAFVVVSKASGGTGALPSGLVATKVLAGFWGDSALLTTALKSQIQTFVKKVPSATTLLCTGSTSNSRVTARDKALAKSRALAACTFAKSQKPALKTKIAINPSSGLGVKARNVSLKLSN